MGANGAEGSAVPPSLLAGFRLAAGLTQEELAERSGLSVRGIRDLERGVVRRPRRRSLDDLAAALGLSESDRDSFIRHYRGHTVGNGPGLDTWSPRFGAAEPARPAQLPAAPRTLIGRAAELDRLDQLCAQRSQAMTIVTIDGLGGVGKTALATHWAHARRSAFPDGQLFAGFRGYAAGPPIEPNAVLGRFLRSLGVPGERVPTELEERESLLRTLLADRQILIVLDNVRSSEQVRPLLPGTPGSMVLITSRNRLRGLTVVNGASRLPVEPLAPAAAADLFSAAAEHRRMPSDLDGAAIIEQCGGLPLALTLAGNRAMDAAGPESIMAELMAADNSVARYADDESASLRSVFSWSVAALSGPSARLFRLLGCHLGVDLTVDSAAALAGCGLAEARMQLDELADAHLLEERAAGRFEMHDLLAKYAGRLAGSDLTADERHQAVLRVLDHSAAMALAAADRYEPLPTELLPIPVSRAEVAHGSFVDQADALAWLDRERANLVAITAAAAGIAGPPYAQQLAALLFRYLIIFGHRDDALRVAEAALDDAFRRGDLGGQARLHSDLGALNTTLGRGHAAVDHELQALELAMAGGDQTEEIRAGLYLGMTYCHLGRYSEAIGRLEQTLAKISAEPTPRILAATLNSLALGYCRVGEFRRAADTAERSIKVSREVGNHIAEAQALAALGEARLGSGRTEAAAQALTTATEVARRNGQAEPECLALCTLVRLELDRGHDQTAFARARRAVVLAEGDGNPYLQTRALNALGAAETALGDRGRAMEHHARALRLARRIGDTYEEAVALGALDPVETSSRTEPERSEPKRNSGDTTEVR